MHNENEVREQVYFEGNLPLFKNVEGHHRKVPFFLSSEMYSDLPFEIAGGDISNLIDSPVADFHAHEVDEIYLLISPEAGDTDIEVETPTCKRVYSSPATILIPAGVKHRFVTKKAVKGSFCFGIFLNHRTVKNGT